MILNGVIALILRFSPNSIVLQAAYVMAVDDRPKNYCLSYPVFPILAKTNAPCSAGTLR